MSQEFTYNYYLFLKICLIYVLIEIGRNNRFPSLSLSLRAIIITILIPPRLRNIKLVVGRFYHLFRRIRLR